jgi:hypothetical protein
MLEKSSKFGKQIKSYYVSTCLFSILKVEISINYDETGVKFPFVTARSRVADSEGAEGVMLMVPILMLMVPVWSIYRVE